jgi:uncharacterized protein (TIGR02466 family)
MVMTPMGEGGSGDDLVVLPFPLAERVRSAFATPVVNYMWPDSEGLNAELAEFIKNSSKDASGDVRSNVGAWHSGSDFLDRDEPCVRALAARIRAIDRALAPAFFEQDEHGALPARRLTGWANVLPPGGYHIPHVHPESFWSGVYYVNGNDPVEGHPMSGKLELLDPRMGGGLSAPVRTPLYGRLLYDPEPGQMILFPSWLQHFVHPYFGRSERITVAFNLSLVVRSPEP